MIQEIVARSVGAEIGVYKHMVGSLHLYKKDREKAQQFLDEGFMGKHPMPKSLRYSGSLSLTA